MTVDSIFASITLKGRIFNDSSGATGAIGTEITTDLGSLELDSLYTRVFTASELDSTTVTYDSFPNVELGGSVIAGDDKLPLLLNGLHVVALKVVAIDGSTPAGYVTITLNKLGNESATPAPTNQKLEAGDSLILMTEYGWPANAASAITLTGSADLANVYVIFALAGDTTTLGTGYAS